MRRLFAVLVLAAVVAMHGTPARAAAGDAGHGGALVDMTVAAPSALPGAHFLDQPGPLAPSGVAPASPVTPGHGVDSHVLAACLAVLLAALTLLAAVVPTGQRARPLLRGPTVRPLSGWKVPPRPPDLFALCLLRT